MKKQNYLLFVFIRVDSFVFTLHFRSMSEFFRVHSGVPRAIQPLVTAQPLLPFSENRPKRARSPSNELSFNQQSSCASLARSSNGSSLKAVFDDAALDMYSSQPLTPSLSSQQSTPSTGLKRANAAFVVSGPSSSLFSAMNKKADSSASIHVESTFSMQSNNVFAVRGEKTVDQSIIRRTARVVFNENCDLALFFIRAAKGKIHDRKLRAVICLILAITQSHPINVKPNFCQCDSIQNIILKYTLLTPDNIAGKFSKDFFAFFKCYSIEIFKFDDVLVVMLPFNSILNYYVKLRYLMRYFSAKICHLIWTWGAGTNIFLLNEWVNLWLCSLNECPFAW